MASNLRPQATVERMARHSLAQALGLVGFMLLAACASPASRKRVVVASARRRISALRTRPRGSAAMSSLLSIRARRLATPAKMSNTTEAMRIVDARRALGNADARRPRDGSSDGFRA